MSVEFLSTLAEWLHDIGATYVHLQDIQRVPSLQERLPKASLIERELLAAHRLRDEHGVPFWEALLLQAARSGSVEPDLLNGAGYQHENERPPESHATETLPSLVDAMSRADQRGDSVALLSLLPSPERQSRHLALLDLRVAATSDGLRTARRLASHLGGGLLVNSGNSFHLYGDQVLDQRGFHAFLGLAAQFNPLIDGRWTAHQHRAGRAALRISPRAGISPRVLEIVDGD